jgi:hypothetical protein
MDDVSPMTPRALGPLFIDKHCPDCGALLVRAPMDVVRVTDDEGVIVRGTASGTVNDEFVCPTVSCSIDPASGKKMLYMDLPKSYEDELVRRSQTPRGERVSARELMKKLETEQ